MVSGRGVFGNLSREPPANSPLATLPWVTNFNTGQGTFYAMDGEIVSAEPWNNLSLQDVLPTWRWIVHSDGTKLAPSIDFDDAYRGGHAGWELSYPSISMCVLKPLLTCGEIK